MKLNDAITGRDFEGTDLTDSDILSDVCIVARVIPESGTSRVGIWTTEGTDGIVQMGLLVVAKGVLESGWSEADDDDADD